MKPEPKTAADCELRLAKWEKPCLGPTDASENLDYYVYPVEGQAPHSPKCVCEGTGRVPAFPTLRKVGVHGRCPERGECNYGGDYGYCQGRGWVVAEVRLEEAFNLIQWSHFEMSSYRAYDVKFDLPQGRTTGWVHGNTIDEAVWRAVVAAVQAQEESK